MLSKDLNWHDDHPYAQYIQKIVPQSRWTFKIEGALLRIWEASHYDYKIYKSKDDSTFFDLDLDILLGQETALQGEIKKEDKAFEDLAKKLEEFQKTVGVPEESSEHDSEEHSSEEEVKPKKKAVSKKSPQQTLKAYKSSLATSQVKLKALQQRLEEVQLKKDAFVRYRMADQYYSKAMKEIVQHYIQTQNETCLIENLDKMFEEYDKQMREGSRQVACSGTDFCEAHYLPLSSVPTGKPFSFQLKCRVSPRIA